MKIPYLDGATYDEEYGGYVDKDGCHWDDAEAFLVSGVLKYCGCSESISVLEVVIAVLDRMQAYETLDWDAFVDKFFGGVSGAAYTVITMLDEMRFLEHGTSCRYSWPTETGELLLQSCKLVLEELREHGLIRITITI